MARKRTPTPSLTELQAAAQAHAVEVLRTVPFHLPEMPEDKYEATMNTIVQQLVHAWAAGYAAGRL